jgi:1-phosphofructokinase
MILTVTPNPAVDQVIELDEPLEADAVQRSTETRFDSGGNGINVSQFVNALGGETLATGVLGEFTGYFIREDLEGFDVPIDFTETESGPTRLNTTILSPVDTSPQTSRVEEDTDEQKEQYQLAQPGPSVSAETVDELFETVQAHDPDIVYLGGSLPPGMEPADIDRLAAAGDWETAVDVHGDVLQQLEGSYEYCRANDVHLSAATGVDIDSINTCEEAAIALQAEGFERVVASMGEEGAMIVSEEYTLYAPAPDVNVVDDVAAGDALFAGVLWAHQQGWSDEQALRVGVAAARRLVTVSGTSVETLDIEDSMDDVQVWQLQS